MYGVALEHVGLKAQGLKDIVLCDVSCRFLMALIITERGLRERILKLQLLLFSHSHLDDLLYPLLCSRWLYHFRLLEESSLQLAKPDRLKDDSERCALLRVEGKSQLRDYVQYDAWILVITQVKGQHDAVEVVARLRRDQVHLLPHLALYPLVDLLELPAEVPEALGDRNRLELDGQVLKLVKEVNLEPQVVSLVPLVFVVAVLSRLKPVLLGKLAVDKALLHFVIEAHRVLLVGPPVVLREALEQLQSFQADVPMYYGGLQDELLNHGPADILAQDEVAKPVT